MASSHDFDVRMARRATLHHPRNESEVADLIRRAAREGRQLRVRGSLHSIPAAIHTDGAEDLELCLDRMRAIHIDHATAEVRVQAGCHLGEDPRDPTGASTWDRRLVAALDAAARTPLTRHWRAALGVQP